MVRKEGVKYKDGGHGKSGQRAREEGTEGTGRGIQGTGRGKEGHGEGEQSAWEEGTEGTGRADRGQARRNRGHGKSRQRAREERDIVMGRDIMSISGEGVWAAKFMGRKSIMKQFCNFFFQTVEIFYRKTVLQ